MQSLSPKCTYSSRICTYCKIVLKFWIIHNKKHRHKVGVFYWWGLLAIRDRHLLCKCAGSHLSDSRQELAHVRRSEKSSLKANTQLPHPYPCGRYFYLVRIAGASNSATKSFAVPHTADGGILPCEEMLRIMYNQYVKCNYRIFYPERQYPALTPVGRFFILRSYTTQQLSQVPYQTPPAASIQEYSAYHSLRHTFCRGLFYPPQR